MNTFTHTHTQLTLIITLFLSTNQYQQVLINNNVRIHIYIKKLDCKPLKERGVVPISIELESC